MRTASPYGARQMKPMPQKARTRISLYKAFELERRLLSDSFAGRIDGAEWVFRCLLCNRELRFAAAEGLDTVRHECAMHLRKCVGGRSVEERRGMAGDTGA